jgi:hypothetical protein
MRAQEAMREVMAYESVIDRAAKTMVELSPNEKKELDSRFKDKKESLRTSLVTAFRWILHPDEDRLTAVALPVPATKDETIATRVVDRLSDMDYGHPKVMTTISAVFFNSRIAPRLWKDDAAPLDIEEASRRFRQWTYLPILPRRDETFRACIREGIGQGLWAVVIGDNSTSKYNQLVDGPERLDALQTLFDGSASLVKGELLALIRDELKPSAEGNGPEPEVEVEYPAPQPGTDTQVKEREPKIPAPSRRLTRVKVRLDSLPITKTSNLQPYLFRVIQEQDAGAELVLELEVSCQAGISEEVLEKRIVEGLEQLGIEVSWSSEQ